MIWATVSSWSCFCWLYRASPSLAAKKIFNLISVSTIWWCPCVESSRCNQTSTELPRWHGGKESACQSRRHKRRGFSHWVEKIPWRRKWQPTPVFLPGEVHIQRCLAVCSSRGCKKSDMTKHAHNTHTHSNFLLSSVSNLESTAHQQVSSAWSLKLS